LTTSVLTYGSEVQTTKKTHGKGLSTPEMKVASRISGHRLLDLK